MSIPIICKEVFVQLLVPLKSKLRILHLNKKHPSLTLTRDLKIQRRDGNENVA